MQQRTFDYNTQKTPARNGFGTYTRKQFGTNMLPIQPATPVKFPHKNKKPKQNIIQKAISFTFLILLLTIVVPNCFKNTTRAMFIAPFQTKHIKVDYNDLLNKTSKLFANDYFLGEKLFLNAENKKPQMQSLQLSDEIIPLTQRLKAVAQNYPSIEPTVFVMDLETKHWAAIQPDKLYSAASIIKLPVLIELFQRIDKGQINLNDKMTLTNYYRAEGSGSLQYQREGNQYTIDNLARVMIEHSDNSATNMLMAKMGSTVAVNRAIRRWGLKNTYVNNWLPDLKGTNYTTARDLATMLYNLDNPEFLSLQSRDKIVDYMSNVTNDRLLKAGLPPNAAIIHKTGDIGKTLGDAGIIYAPNGRKYIAVVMANRPYNSVQGKNYIVETSCAIYNYMINGQQ